jgi:cell wall-associated NlpC family hydrolase
MLFFKLKTNQKLILSVLLGVTLLASCSTSKKASVAAKRERTSDTKVKDFEPSVKDSDNGKTAAGDNKEEEVSKNSSSDAENKAEKVISTARTFIGTPYKYGGTTRSGMDCSALLINSFGAVKLNLPRSSEAQSKVGTEVKIHELKPGDLVFFATGNKKKEITHVGLITDVRSKDNIKFIHASSSLGVVETNLFAEYYQKRFRVARRVIE